MSSLEHALLAVHRASSSIRVETDLDTRAAHQGDESGLSGVVPGAVIFPRSAEEVSIVLRAASEHHVPVSPRGGATGKCGGAIGYAEGIALCLTSLETHLDLAGPLATASAGLPTEALRVAAQGAGYDYPVDPSSLLTCTLGGNVATNASGPSSYRHGDTRRWTLGLEFVTGRGDIQRFGRATSKASVGPDVSSLIVGSEGILGVVTRVFMRLAPMPERILLVSVTLASMASVDRALSQLTATALPLRSIELLDDQTLAVLRTSTSDKTLVGAGVGAVLLLELEGSERQLEHDLERLASLLEHDALEIIVARNEREREQIWAIRRATSYALKASARFKLSDDVVVPRPRVGALLSTCRELAEHHGIRMPAYGHAGDGNLHVNFLWDDPAQRPAVERAMDALFVAVTELGGTLSGEHGLGLSKARYLPLVRGEAELQLLRDLKSLFDPAGILNPGKVLPARP